MPPHQIPKDLPDNATLPAEKRHFEWSPSTEPHILRKEQIMAKHGDAVRKLFGIDENLRYKIAFSVMAQVFLAW